MSLSSTSQLNYGYNDQQKQTPRTFLLDRSHGRIQHEFSDDTNFESRIGPPHGHTGTSRTPCPELPDDVLRDIFKLCREDVPLCVPIKSRKDLALIHVCSSWRQLALELWVKVSVILDPGTKGERALQVAHELFSYARSMPRCLELRMFQPSQHDVAGRLIAPFCYRKLHLQIHYSEWQRILNLPADVLASVENLELYPPGHNNPYEVTKSYHPLFTGNMNLASLQHLFLTGYWDLKGLELGCLKWNQLVSLQINSNTAIKPTLCHDILRQSMVLRHCSLVLDSTDDDDNPRSASDSYSYPTEDIVLPQLQTLALAFSDGEDAHTFLRALILPGVLSINFRPVLSSQIGKALQVETKDLTRMILRSEGMPRLRQLYVGTTQILIEAGPILELLPDLEEIVIRCGFLGAHAMGGVATGRLGRCLRRIFLRGPHDGHKLVKMIRHRQREAQNSNSQVAWISKGAFTCFPVVEPVRKKLARAISQWEDSDITLEFQS